MCLSLSALGSFLLVVKCSGIFVEYSQIIYSAEDRRRQKQERRRMKKKGRGKKEGMNRGG